MHSVRGSNHPYFNDGYNGQDWDDYGPDSNMGNTRNDRYSNAYGDYRGGYGPMNSGILGFGPINLGGGFGPMNSGGFGPPNMGSGVFDPLGFGPGPRPLFPPTEMPYLMGRGYGPSGPVKIKKSNDKTVRYLLRCGVPKENLRNLPRELLQLMTPENCDLCGQCFNSFTISRTHYVSKNHCKNQKKWLSQHAEGGYQQNREIPFKSRDLYCEICDVHITSKVHADSHYSGKPHRSIVEGRKMPRNPILLQQNMANRLEQLIRREKKNLKPLDEIEEKVPEKKPKVFQSELYCEICKTSVTCTEQMTMHLNGKRHLTKEKQHILKMMKGETNDKEKKKTGGGVGGVVEDNDEAEKAGENENEEEEGDGEGAGADDKEDAGQQDEEDYDWGNGSGTWDEPETIQW